MMPKSGITPDGYFDYTVFPLEGVLDLKEEAREAEKLDKDKLIYTLVIRQPDFATEELAQTIIENTKKKKDHNLLQYVRFKSIEDGLCIQMMHIGSYDDEPASFTLMEEFCNINGLKRIGKTHMEVYISDFRKTQPEKLKTILRIKVERNLDKL